MNALAKHLAQDLNQVHTNVEVMTVTAAGEDWLVQDHDGNIYTSKALLMTPPVPQSLDLLRAGATPLSADDQHILEQIAYAPCLCGLFWVDGTLHLPDPGAIHRPDAPIPWIADNRHKGISPEATILTVQAAPDYSRDLWLAPDHDILEALRASLKPYIEPQTKIREAQLKRWDYAMVERGHDAPCLIAEEGPPLIFAGDAFGMPTVEGAALSGLAAGRVLYEMMSAV
jgi:predicted NAD/FAD-dependent oxidoreductase